MGFKREIVQVYYSRFRSEKTLPVIFQKNTQRINLDIRYDGIDHWIDKGNQRRCAKCSKTSIFVKSAMLVFIQIVLRIFKSNRLQYKEKLLGDLKKKFSLTLRFIFKGLPITLT